MRKIVVLEHISLDGVIQAFQPEEHLVRPGLAAETRRLKRLNEIDVEVAFGLRRRPIVRGAEKQIAVAIDAVILPLDLVLPDLMAGDVRRLVRALHQLADRAVIGAVERVVRQSLGALLDLGVVIDVLLQIEVVLFGIRRFRDRR